jgi:cell division protein FtsL
MAVATKRGGSRAKFGSRRIPRPVGSQRKPTVVVGFLIVVIAMVGLAIVYCAGYARIHALDLEHKSLQREIRKLEDERRELERKLGELRSPERISRQAESDGMVYACAEPFRVVGPHPEDRVAAASPRGFGTQILNSALLVNPAELGER